MIAWSLVLALAAQTPSAPASPQPPQPGQWVRITTAAPARILEGRLKTLSEESLVIEQPGGASEGAALLAVAVPRSSVARVDLRVQESRKARGALIGAGAGIVIGFAAGSAGSSGSGTIVAVAPAAVAVAGALLGGVIGVIVAPGATWQKGIPLDRVRVSVGPVRRGARFSMTVTF